MGRILLLLIVGVVAVMVVSWLLGELLRQRRRWGLAPRPIGDWRL